MRSSHTQNMANIEWRLEFCDTFMCRDIAWKYDYILRPKKTRSETTPEIVFLPSLIAMYMQPEVCALQMRSRWGLDELANTSGVFSHKVCLINIQNSSGVCACSYAQLLTALLLCRCVSRYCHNWQADGQWPPSVCCDYHQGDCWKVCQLWSGVLQHSMHSV